MEVIELPGYIPEEKLNIAMRHLIPRVLDQHGLNFDFLQIPEGTVKLIVQRYTREAGVHNLERNLAAIACAAVVRVAEQEHDVLLSKDVHQFASPLLESRLADGAEVEMEIIPMGVNNHDISQALRITSPLVVDEAMLEKPPRYDGRETVERVATAVVERFNLLKRLQWWEKFCWYWWGRVRCDKRNFRSTYKPQSSEMTTKLQPRMESLIRAPTRPKDLCPLASEGTPEIFVRISKP
ncbi:unnamed protein product [Fraxinus pennsylvanica]|uniref:Lon protease AAA+ ATPase lid domain-containing protein n=1 Tax=Fraxinus pennsylvanica TaxID=56036 RepID=A0AAD1Z1I1_9LAMI|nr:unnamed protein product [Fraxinus pennsylvanica]